ncbi:MAG: Imm39 family immunity protein [Pyrinomonadaceae bacterium]
MKNRRILLIGGVSTVKGRINDVGLVMKEICDELEPALTQNGFTDAAPFETVSLVIRFGKTVNLTPNFGRIDHANAELPVAIEMELRLRREPREMIKYTLTNSTIDVLTSVASKYNLPSDFLDEYRSLKQ